MNHGSGPFVVPHPFATEGDCILRSSQGDAFLVFKIVLSLASPVFRDMFHLPQPEDRNNDLPVITVAENSTTLLGLLRSIYPPSDADLDIGDIALIRGVYTAHVKYDIPVSKMDATIDRMFAPIPNGLLSNRGIELYALAWRLELKERIPLAAKYTHQTDIFDVGIAAALVEEAGSLEALLALMKLRSRREAALVKLIETLRVNEELCSVHGGHTGAFRHDYPEDMEFDPESAVEYDRTTAYYRDHLLCRARLALAHPDARTLDIRDALGLLDHKDGGPWGYDHEPCGPKKCFHGLDHEKAAQAQYLIKWFPEDISRW